MLGNYAQRNQAEFKQAVTDLENHTMYDKFHCSIDRNNIEKAASLIIGFMNSRGCPFRQFKLSHLPKSEREEKYDELESNRVFAGAQLAFYARTRKDGTYSADTFINIGRFFKLLQQTLEQAGIRPGTVPDSDIGIPGNDYISYRNACFKRWPADKKEAAEIRRILAEQPFFEFVCAAYRRFENKPIKTQLVEGETLVSKESPL